MVWHSDRVMMLDKVSSPVTYRASPSLQNGQVQASLRLRRPGAGGLMSSSSIAVLSSKLSPPACSACSPEMLRGDILEEYDHLYTGLHLGLFRILEVFKLFATI